MQTLMEKLLEQKFLGLSLFFIAFGIIITNLISEDASVIFASWMYVPTAGSVVVLSIIITVKGRLIGSHGKSWLLFMFFAISWFAAEQLWVVNELILDVDPYPSEGDFLWLIGYAFYFGFMMYYLKPFRKMISKKMILYSSLLACIILIPSLYVSYDSELDPTNIENVIGLSYPLLDAVVFVPAIIGVTLFFTGKVNFLWALMCLAIVTVVVADTGFLFGILEEDYYSGHPVEILFHWTYILFAFGLYDHYKIFKLKQKSGKKLSEDIP